MKYEFCSGCIIYQNCKNPPEEECEHYYLNQRLKELLKNVDPKAKEDAEAYEGRAEKMNKLVKELIGGLG